MISTRPFSLIGEWRAIKPDIYVNLTTGTYPSPFWLRYADSIWRGGDDSNFAGVGIVARKVDHLSRRRHYAGIVKKGPLFPLNSLMLHGIIYARQAENSSNDPGTLSLTRSTVTLAKEPSCRSCTSRTH